MGIATVWDVFYSDRSPPSPWASFTDTVGISQGDERMSTYADPQALQIRDGLQTAYADVLTPSALAALAALASFNADQKELMAKRMRRRLNRAQHQEKIGFLEEDSLIPRTQIKVRDARDGNFLGSEIPPDLQRQWIQGTGPAAKPHAPIESSIRNVAYALLSGADGWMFDGEDALGQVDTMSLDNQRNLKLAIHRDPSSCRRPRQVAEEMNAWAVEFHGRRDRRRLASAA